MIYLVELITTMTLVHNMNVPSSSSTEQPFSQSIVSNNNKKKGSDTSSSKSKKTTSSSKKSPTKKSPPKKSSTKKTTTKSSSSSSKRPPPRPTSSRPSTGKSTSSKPSTRPSSSRTTTSRPTTKPSSSRPSSSRPSSSRPSSSSSSHRSTHSSKSSSSTQSTRSSSRPVHPTQRVTPQSKSPQSNVHKNSTPQKVKSVHQNQSRTNVSKKSVQPKTSAGVKVHPSHSTSKIKKPSSDTDKSSKAVRDTKGEHSPHLSKEQLRERREALQNKKPNTSKPEKSINNTRPPKHKPSTVPNRGSRYDSTTERGNTGNRITPSSPKGKGGLTNSHRDSRVDSQHTNDRHNNNDQDGFSTNRNTVPVVIVVEKTSSTPDGWNPEIHRQSSGEDRHWHPNYWGAGVFYYTEPPQNVYIEEHNYYGDTVRKYEAPKRKRDRRKSLSMGLRGGTLGSQVEDFSQDDISWGGAVGYRLFDPIGLEVSYIKTGDEWTTGLKAPAQVSGNLYLFPWTGVSPYITGGISIAEQAGAKNQTDFDLPDGYAYGPHGGVGIEWGIGNHISLNAEGRYTKFKNVDATHTQLSAGLNFYF